MPLTPQHLGPLEGATLSKIEIQDEAHIQNLIVHGTVEGISIPDISGIEGQISTISSTVTTHTGQISTISSTLDGQAIQVEEIQNDLTDLQGDVIDVTSDVGSLTSEVSLISQTVTNQGGSIFALNGSVSSLNSSISTINSNISTIDSGLIGGLVWKKTCRVATTAPLGAPSALTGLLTIDGVTLVAGDRVFVKDEVGSARTNNGIWVVAAGAWSRASDCNSSADYVSQMRISVSEGSTQAGYVFQLDQTSVTMGSTQTTYTLIWPITVSGALVKSGNNIGINQTLIDHTNLQNKGTNTHAQIDTFISNTGNDISAIEGNLTTIENSVSAVEGDISTIQGDVSTIQGDISTIEGSISTIQGDVTTIEGSISTINSDISTIEGNIITINNDLSDLQGDVIDLGNSDTTHTSQISVISSTLSSHTGNTSNPHSTTATQVGALVSIDGVSNAGGNVDLTAGTGIVLTPNDSTNTIGIATNATTTYNALGTIALRDPSTGRLACADGSGSNDVATLGNVSSLTVLFAALYVTNTTFNARVKNSVQWWVVPPGEDVNTANHFITLIMPSLNGRALSAWHAMVANPPAGGTVTVQVIRVRGITPVNMLSTAMQIQDGEMMSSQGTLGTLNVSNSGVQSYDYLIIDVASSGGTPATGLLINLEFV